MGNGICQMTNGLLYRGGCTDNLWNADECPKVCSSKQQNGRDSGAPAGISFIKSCFNRAIPEQTRNPVSFFFSLNMLNGFVMGCEMFNKWKIANEYNSHGSAEQQQTVRTHSFWQ